MEDLVTTIKKGWFYCGQKSNATGKPRGTDPTSISFMNQFTVTSNNDYFIKILLDMHSKSWSSWK